MRFRRFTALLIAVAAWGATVRVAASAVFSESFDGPELCWRLLDARSDARVLAHGSVTDQARQGTGSERLICTSPGGESLHFACPVGRLPVVDEFEAGIWLRSNLPGTSLAARVILPRSKSPDSDAARSLIVVCDTLESTDRWQQLRVTNLPQLLAAQVRVLRATQRTAIDPREAYVDAIVLVVPGGSESTTVWTDELEVDGVALVSAPADSRAGASPAVFSAPSWPQSSRDSAPASPTAHAASVQFRGTTLLVAGRPFLSRGIDWNGEPFAFLAARGFNTIWLDELPTAEQTAQATQANMWLVCRPPLPDQLTELGIGTSLERLLAWSLGSPRGPHELDYFRRWADELRDSESGSTRPILITPRGDWLPASQLADALVADHPAAATLREPEFAGWLAQLPLLARPGTPLWVTVPTQPRTTTRKQAALLMPGLARTPTILPDRQIEDLLTIATISGCRGLHFESESPLDGTDAVTRRRAALLEQLNDRLELIEPWLTIGKRASDASTTDGAIRGIILQAERARLYVPDHPFAGADLSDAGAQNLALLIPGIPQSNEAFALSPAGFQQLVSKRVAGGIRIELPREYNGYVLLTEDPAVVTRYRQRVARGARRAAQVQYGLAAGQSRALADAARQLQAGGISTKPLDEAIRVADADTRAAGASLTAGNFAVAYRQAARASRALESAIDQTRRGIPQGPAFDSVPCIEQPTPFVARAAFERSFAGLRADDNQLVGGDFEDLDLLRQVGWQHVEDPLPGIQTKVALSGTLPHDGRYSLQLVSMADSLVDSPQIVARAPAWITTPPFRVVAGEVLEISGWVRVEQPLTGSVEGLEITDSLGGHELALRIHKTEGWQPFRLVRATTDTTNATLTFALHGLGSVAIDSVMVRSLAGPKVKRLPSTGDDPGLVFPNSAARPVYPGSARR